jgi:TPR repeat protein
VPDRGSEPVLRLTRYLNEHRHDAEALWWASLLQNAGILKTSRKTTELMRAAADGGHPAAMARLGAALVAGDGVAADPEGGLRLLREAQAKGEPDAALEMGAVTLKGLGGVSKDREKAKEFFKEALRLGTIRAHFHLAALFIETDDQQSAFDHLMTGATAGDSRCMESLAEVFRDGLLGRDVEPRRAVEWMKRAAEHGRPAMQRELAKVLTNGYAGVKPNEATARKLIELGAEAKDPEAMLMLARGYVAGKYGFARDGAKAGKLLGALVEMNYAPGIYTLARLHLEGVVVPQGMTKAQADERANVLMQRAAALGYPPAVEYLKNRGVRAEG